MVHYILAAILLFPACCHGQNQTAVAAPTQIQVEGFEPGDEARFADALKSAMLSGQPVKVTIQSLGGSVFGGLRMIAALNEASRTLHITCHVETYAFSMAAALLQAPGCDSRTMSPYALLLFHGASSQLAGNAQELSNQLEFLNKLNTALATLIASRLGVSVETYLEAVDNRDLTLTGPEALAINAVDRITQ